MSDAIKKLGLIIVGDEILSGKRQDKHLTYMINLLGKRGLELSWVKIIGDDPFILEQTLTDTLQSSNIVFSTGGIGATPDDLTRQAAAVACGQTLTVNQEGLQMLRSKYDYEITPQRLRLITFPEHCRLIPNPINHVPGFSIEHHHFVPGFPQMAWPMFEWVLDTYYADLKAAKPITLAVRITNKHESHIIQTMETLMTRYPGLKVYSLPSIAGEHRSLELGVKGPADTAQRAYADMLDDLKNMQAEWTVVTDKP